MSMSTGSAQALITKSDSVLESYAGFSMRQKQMMLSVYDRTWWYRAFGCTHPTSAARVVAAELVLRTDAGGVCWPSRQRLELDTGVEKRHLRRVISEFLVGTGWVRYLTWDERCAHCLKRGMPLPGKSKNHSIMYALRIPSEEAFELARPLMKRHDAEE